MKGLMEFLAKDNRLAKLLCVFTACCMWVYVMTDLNPISERTVEVRLVQSHIPENMQAFNVPDKVTVKLRGTRFNIFEKLDGKLSAVVDLQNVTEGQQNVPVKVSFSQGEVVSVEPAEVPVYVDTVSEKTIKVRARVVNSGNEDLTIGDAVITPAQVVLRGATHRLSKVSKVVAPVDLKGHENNFTTESELVAVSDDGYDIPNMKITPERVMVNATIVKQLHTVDKPVVLNMQGNLPEGITITNTEIVPKEIKITAPPSVLKNMESIKTKVLDASKITGSAAVALELELPDGVISSQRSVQVRFSVERVAHENKVE